MATIKINGVGFTVEVNAARTEQQFIDRWMPEIWMDIKPSEKELALKGAYQLIKGGVSSAQKVEAVKSAKSSPNDTAAAAADPKQKKDGDK